MDSLIYISDVNCEKEEISEIFKVAVECNEQQNITGILLYSDINFIQYLEGDRKKLKALYFDKICKDNRHKNVRLISFEDQDERVFPSWHLGRFQFLDDEINLFDFDNTNAVERLKTLISKTE